MATPSTFEYVLALGDASKCDLRILSLNGVNLTHDRANANTDRGRLYAKVVASGNNWAVTLYKDPARTQSIASGTATALGTSFALASANGSTITGSAVLNAYTLDDTQITVIASFAHDPDVVKDQAQCAGMPGYDDLYGLSSMHADAMERILTSSLPAAVPHLFGKSGLAAFVPLALGSELPDLRKIVNVSQLREAQSFMVKSISAQQQDHVPAFLEMAKAADARFDQVMMNLQAANIEEKVEAAQEQASDQSVSLSSFSRL